MKAWESIAGDYQQDKREPKEGEYAIKSVGEGTIVCTVPGVQLVDFYRTDTVLAKDVPKCAEVKL